MATVSDILNAAKTRLETLPATAVYFNSSNVSIMDVETFIQSDHQLYAQIIAQPGSAPHARSGVPFFAGALRISVFFRQYLDQRNQQTQRVAGDDALIDILAVIEDNFVHCWLDGTLLVPLTLRVQSVAAGGPTDIASGWVRAYRDFDFAYEPGISNTVTMDDGTTTDRGQSG